MNCCVRLSQWKILCPYCKFGRGPNWRNGAKSRIDSGIHPSPLVVQKYNEKAPIFMYRQHVKIYVWFCQFWEVGGVVRRWGGMIRFSRIWEILSPGITKCTLKSQQPKSSRILSFSDKSASGIIAMETRLFNEYYQKKSHLMQYIIFQRWL